MSDSVKDIDLSQPAVFEKPAGTEMIVQRNGSPVKLVKDKGGKFVKQQKPMPEARDITRLMRRLLVEAEPNSEGKIDKQATTRIRRMFDNMISIATASASEVLLDKLGNVVRDSKGNPIMINDAKMAMASVKAFEALMARAYGKVAPGDDELDALKVAGVKIVVVQPPELMHKEVVPERPKEALQPSFIEGEVVSTNKQ